MWIRIRNTAFYYPRYIDIDITSLSFALFLTRLTYSIFNIATFNNSDPIKKGKRRWEKCLRGGEKAVAPRPA
jgi:hypothetical protein